MILKIREVIIPLKKRATAIGEIAPDVAPGLPFCSSTKYEIPLRPGMN